MRKKNKMTAKKIDGEREMKTGGKEMKRNVKKKTSPLIKKIIYLIFS